jgi:hypothetical protein
MGTRRPSFPRPNRGQSFNEAFPYLDSDEQFAVVAGTVLAPILPRPYRKLARAPVRAALAAARLKARMGREQL